MVGGLGGRFKVRAAAIQSSRHSVQLDYLQQRPDQIFTPGLFFWPRDDIPLVFDVVLNVHMLLGGNFQQRSRKYQLSGFLSCSQCMSRSFSPIPIRPPKRKHAQSPVLFDKVVMQSLNQEPCEKSVQ